MITSDSTWKCSPGPIIFNAIRQGETYDARLEKEGWMLPGYDESDWYDVRLVRGPEGIMRSQSMPPIRITEKRNPVQVRKIQNNIWVCDFGQNIAGFAELSVSAESGTRIVMKYGEKLYPDGTVDQRNIDGLVAEKPFQTDQYITNGKGPETWHPRFVYHGFRYVEVRGFPGTLSPDQIKACIVHTDFEKKGTFETSSKLVNRIQQNTEWSFVNNFHGYPTDCPHREKNGWTGDAQLASEMALYNFQVETAYDKWIRDILDVQLASGMIPAIVPTGGWGYYWGNGPAWDYALLVIPWNTYLYSGDRQMLEKYYPYMVKYMSFLTSTAENHIVRWGLGDWVPVRTTTPPELITTAYYYQDAVLMSRMSSILGEKEDMEYFRDLAGKIKNAFQDEFTDRTNGLNAGNGSQTSLGCALYFSLLDSTDNDIIAEKLIHQIRESDLNLDFGVLGSKFVPNALALNGYREEAFKMIHNEKFPGWGNWVSRGATTLWEDWEGEASRNHVFFGDVSAWFYKFLAGIQVDEKNPGFKHFFIRPFFPEALSWVNAEVQSYYGNIVSKWTRHDDKIELDITIPFNTSATIELQDVVEVMVTDLVNGEKVELMKVQNNKENFSSRLGSGKYRINISVNH
jgi:alpha-L-rhamnosidase